ncbi:MYND-type domain-containing protein [Favolaschia claudopus]|uniref:MYND-type domain-containing protein n=1 Tax=Favolaschia claudopus TaxID=2862362 RepID=A0AAW0AGB2_9AGAR
MTFLEIRAFIYGFENRHCEVLLRKEVPQQATDNLTLLDGWAQKTVMTVGYDLKHTSRWECEICGTPAREMWIDPRPSLNISEPLVVLHVHHVCEAGGGPCHTEVQNRARELALKAGGALPAPSMPLPKPSDAELPLASSCAKCEEEKTGALGFPISRCSRCKLIRQVQLSIKCQTEDWPRHGKICKMIKEVKWGNEEQALATNPESHSETSSRTAGTSRLEIIQTIIAAFICLAAAIYYMRAG